MIKSLRVRDLNSRISVSLNFHPDLNIITGKNGSGKTTILKLLWYLISGNLERIPELAFSECDLEHSLFRIRIACFGDRQPQSLPRQYVVAQTAVLRASTNQLLPRRAVAKQAVRRSSVRSGKTSKTEGFFQIEFATADGTEKTVDKVPYAEAHPFLDQLNHTLVKYSASSLFFPTFRRLEGGFDTVAERVVGIEHPGTRAPFTELSNALATLSRALSVGGTPATEYDHRFVASLSAIDLVRLITERYTDISRQTDALHTELSTFIESRIPAANKTTRTGGALHSAPTKSKRAADRILQEIAQHVQGTTRRRAALLEPITKLSDVCSTLFDRAISITDKLTLGAQKGKVAAGLLSGGEKQMFSFLAYNGLFQGRPIFIDEPELSLHVDWQRRLVPLLQDQKANNQLVIATHSPFIYSKYPDREIALDSNRGDAEGQ